MALAFIYKLSKA